jgi:hypothetical protein
MSEIEAAIRKATKMLSVAQTLFNQLLRAPRVSVGAAAPPTKNGVYAFSLDDEIIYVGEAAGSGGLKDRILRKHVSGDEGHALQNELTLRFPDRIDRRNFIKNAIDVQWIEIADSLMVSLVEKLAIAVIQPRLNKSVKSRTCK